MTDLEVGIQKIFFRLKEPEFVRTLVGIREIGKGEFVDALNEILFNGTPLDFEIIHDDVRNKAWYMNIVREVSNGLAMLKWQNKLSRKQRGGVDNDMFMQRIEQAILSSKVELNKLKFKKLYFLSR